ncbi:MAG: SpoIIE family protein phosphatase [Ruminococcus sp.]|nr:SpoIIE family protein phosphatase [Ruminococcus sp.]
MSEKVKVRSGGPAVRQDAAVVEKGRERTLKALISAAAAFVTGLGSLLGFPSYMCAAAAALSGGYIIPAFVGAVGAYLLRGSFEGGIVQLCSILTLAALRAVDPFGERRDEPVYLSVMTTGVLMLFGCVMSVAVPADFYTASMRMINSLLAGCVVFVAKSVAAARSRSGVYDLTGINGVFVGIIYIMSVAVLTSVTLMSVNLGRIFGAFILLQTVRKYRSFGGAAVGALTTCGVLICEPDLARNTLLLATSGLICGAFVQMGTLATVLAFLISSLVSLVAVGVNGDTYRMFADMVIGSMLFVAVPMPAVKKLGRRIAGFGSSLDIVGQTTSSRLSLAGEALGGIRRQLSMVTAAMDRKTASLSAAADVRRCICSECPSDGLCFGRSDNGSRAFAELEELVRKRGCVSGDEAAEKLRFCSRPDLIGRAFTDFQARLAEEKAENIRMREMREFLAEQLSSMEDILNDLSYRSSQVRSIDPGLSARLKDYFAVIGYPGARACVYVDENLCRRADVFVSSDFDGDTVKITAAVSSLLDCDMSLPDMVGEDGLTRISFAEIPAYSAETASFSSSAGGEYSGDSFEIFEINGNEKYILLSDGMGTGKRARLDSMFTVSLTRKLICSGMSMATAHRLINSMLRVKGWEESFATLDLMKLDLSGGAAKLLKSGAVKSRLCRDGCVTAFGGQAFPAGILCDCIPDISDIKLFDGDIIVMTSDGVDEEAAEEIARLAALNSCAPLEDIVRKMGELALSERAKENPDDLTVIAVRIRLNSRN